MTDWSAGTYEGSERASARAVAEATPAQRLAWLEDVLLLAAASGALDRVRRERQQACEQDWARGHSAAGDGTA